MKKLTECKNYVFCYSRNTTFSFETTVRGIFARLKFMFRWNKIAHISLVSHSFLEDTATKSALCLMKDLCREEPSLNAIFFAMSVYKCPFSQSPAILKSCFCHAKTDLFRFEWRPTRRQKRIKINPNFRILPSYWSHSNLDWFFQSC